MPDFPLVGDAPRKNTRNFSVNLLCAGGDGASVQFTDVAVAVAGAELANARTAVGNLSNGAVRQTNQTEVVSVADTKVNPLDEAYADSATKMVLTFQNDDQEIKTIAIPAPDESYFGSDGISVIVPNGAAAAGTPARLLADAISAFLIVLNGGALGNGTFAYLKGYRSRRTSRLPRPRTARSSVEPGAGIEPGDEPGV